MQLQLLTVSTNVNSLEEDACTMIRAPRTIAIVKRIFMFPITDEKRDRTTSLQSNSTLIVSRNFLKRWFCSFPSSTLKISRVWWINNGFRRKWTIREKIEGQAKAVSLDPHGVKNAWKCHELWWSFSSGECFLLKKMKKAMPPLAGHD